VRKSGLYNILTRPTNLAVATDRPLNPVLGELFYGFWPPTPTCASKTDLLVEQVSHHPPITAYVIRNYTVDKKGGQKERVRLIGHNAQKTSFSGTYTTSRSKNIYFEAASTGGSIIVRQIGHATLTVTLPDGGQEQYLITLPRLRIDGLWYGSPYIELTESSYIAQSTPDGKAGGWVGTIEYKGKGYFSGKSHQFKAVLTPPEPSSSDHSDSHHHHKPHVIEGTWHTTSKMESGMTFHDVNGPKTEVTTKSVEEQGEWESRKLWSKVSKGIREADFECASREKGRIEVCQDSMMTRRCTDPFFRTSKGRGGKMNLPLVPPGS
jgi:oxysterol-binding protein-related protein 9/10/11